MNSKDFELDTEQAAALLSTYAALKRHGQSFDPTLDAVMIVLRWQLIESLDGEHFRDDSVEMRAAR